MVFIFILSWVLLFIVAVRLMIRGLSIDPQRDVDLSYKVEKRTRPTFSLEGNSSWAGATPNAFESKSNSLFQNNAGTLFSLSDATDDLCASFSAEI